MTVVQSNSIWLAHANIVATVCIHRLILAPPVYNHLDAHVSTPITLLNNIVVATLSQIGATKMDDGLAKSNPV